MKRREVLDLLRNAGLMADYERLLNSTFSYSEPDIQWLVNRAKAAMAIERQERESKARREGYFGS